MEFSYRRYILRRQIFLFLRHFVCVAVGLFYLIYSMSIFKELHLVYSFLVFILVGLFSIFHLCFLIYNLIPIVKWLLKGKSSIIGEIEKIKIYDINHRFASVIITIRYYDEAGMARYINTEEVKVKRSVAEGNAMYYDSIKDKKVKAEFYISIYNPKKAFLKEIIVE